MPSQYRPGLPTENYVQESIVEYQTSQKKQAFDGSLLDDGEYISVDQSKYDKKRCLIPDEVIAFLRISQPDKWDEIVRQAGSESRAIKSILDRMASELCSKKKKNEGNTIDFLHKGEFDAGYGLRFRPVYFKPVNDKSPEHVAGYQANRIAIVKELQYSETNTNEIDLAIFLNGIPLITIELKNALTGQTHHNAIKQYMRDRKVKGEPLLQFKRCLVHFALGTDQIYMTTKLNDEKTRFFPFNQTIENIGVNNGGIRTDYLWRDVLRRDSLIDLVENFINIQIDKEKKYDPKSRTIIEDVKESLIFPRWHQRRAVLRLEEAVKRQGVGHCYLIQHSAGSGKSNTISWLAFRLMRLYRSNSDDKVMFDSVIVVTDRRALNKQLSDNIKQFSRVDGEFVSIDEKCNSQDLKRAIQNRARVIATTIQKFPYIAVEITKYPDRNFAILIDEAHSSQTGEDARALRKALSLRDAEIKDAKEEAMRNDGEDDVNKFIEHELEQLSAKNISFFAFTATPKPKTIELFCERENGTKEPFDKYTMEQAIREGFIHDVLKNPYMSFSRYYKLIRRGAEPDKEYEKKKTVRVLSNYVDLTDTAIERKSRIMIEHFISQTEKEIQGEARAMLITRSRLHAVRYKLKFDEIMQEMRLPYKALVAFSGKVYDPETGLEYTETSMNNIEGNMPIPDAFKLPQYRILIVANKYQTGFNEPNLHTMFVDKKLGGPNAVQTLSRLNRNAAGKTGTFILDFVNDPNEIREAFQEFYGANMILEENETDPNALYDLKSRIQDFGMFTQEEIDAFSKYFFLPNQDKTKIYGILEPVKDRALTSMSEEELDSFRKTLRQYINLYTFLIQIITFKDVNLEKLCYFSMALTKMLRGDKEELPYEVLEDAELDSYRLQYNGVRSLSLDSGDSIDKGMTPGGVNKTATEEYDYLSNIIKQLNDQFGLHLTEEDKVDIQRMKDRVTSNEDLMQYFNGENSRANVQERFNEEIDSELLNFINTKLELYNKLSDDRVNNTLKKLWFTELYDRQIRGLRP